ncbi:asparaginyl-tRNA synthetase [Blastocystis sp. subtype 4]|uniref:asparaginyl-tRNA synthetase n=1 Tax=Blastocystis sp. subtype 4 TaxID=944170 RepID=UPI00071162A9|nr:asparaginyl-tRNA synthetase [Blastocystis sp. subtype 4]KNB45869.1 asparaginyl-tRNA synthetase [Blastocystis sp. subtype 4]|eukprot:XP_014529312.1 asparaginyl-tRNA synthetase [Blastocystis sp. subtype 4]
MISVVRFRSIYIPIKRILKQSAGEKVTIQGWVRSKRVFKDFSFVVVNDGSNMNGIQCVLPNTSAHDITTGSSICLKGILKEAVSSKHQDGLELHVDSYSIFGNCDQETYPLQKKFHSPEFLRTIPHLRPRTNLQGVVLRMRNTICQSIHSSLQQEDFIQVMTPIITSNDCEGAGEMFSVVGDKTDFQSFFNTSAYLTVSGQLQAEMMAEAMTRVYTFGPAFRAENSNTTRHLCEFWMVEPEMCFATMDDLKQLAIHVISTVATNLLTKCQEDLSFLSQRIDKELPYQLSTLQNKDNYCHLTYSEAISILTRKGMHFEVPVKWGIDLQSEHERFLCEQYCQNKPLFLTDYPEAIKPFYMKANPDGKTVAAVDLLVPRIGEIIGGSMREDDYDALEGRMLSKGLLSEDYRTGRSVKNLDWYLDLRKYGSVPHGGWGLGLERLIELCTGVQNIRDTIPVPRVPGICLL